MVTTPEQVGVELGRPISDDMEFQQIGSWIRRAEIRIERRLGALEDLDPNVVTDVVVRAVARKVRNPDGFVSESVDDYNYRYNEATRKGEVYITDDEWADLSPGAVDSSVGSTQMYGAPDLPAGWWA